MQLSRSGLNYLQRLAGCQQQIRCVGNATKLFPDASVEQGGAYPQEEGEFGEAGGIPPEIRGRTVRVTHQAPCI